MGFNPDIRYIVKIPKRYDSVLVEHPSPIKNGNLIILPALLHRLFLNSELNSLVLASEFNPDIKYIVKIQKEV